MNCSYKYRLIYGKAPRQYFPKTSFWDCFGCNTVQGPIKITVCTMAGEKYNFFTEKYFETIGDLRRCIIDNLAHINVKPVSIPREILLRPGNDEGYSDNVEDDVTISSLLNDENFIRSGHELLIFIDQPTWTHSEQDAFRLIDQNGTFRFSNSDLVRHGEEVFIWILKNKTQELKNISASNIRPSVMTAFLIKSYVMNALLDLIRNSDSSLEKLDIVYNYKIFKDLAVALYHNTTIKELKIKLGYGGDDISSFFETIKKNTSLTSIQLESDLNSLKYQMRDLVNVLKVNNNLRIIDIHGCMVDTNAQDISNLVNVLDTTNLEKLNIFGMIPENKDGNKWHCLQLRQEIERLELERLRITFFGTHFRLSWENLQ